MLHISNEQDIKLMEALVSGNIAQPCNYTPQSKEEIVANINEMVSLMVEKPKCPYIKFIKECCVDGPELEENWIDNYYLFFPESLRHEVPTGYERNVFFSPTLPENTLGLKPKCGTLDVRMPGELRFGEFEARVVDSFSNATGITPEHLKQLYHPSLTASEFYNNHLHFQKKSSEDESYPPNEDGTVGIWKYETSHSIVEIRRTVYIPEVIKYRTISEDNRENQGHCCATASQKQCDYLRKRGCVQCIFHECNFHLFEKLIDNMESSDD